MVTPATIEQDGSGPDLHLRIANRVDALGPARLAVLGHLGDRVGSPQALYRIELVLEEALMNIVRHAFADDGAHTIDLRVSLTADEVLLQLEDDGIAFDPLPPRQAQWPASVAEARPGGLGLMLVQRFASSLAHQRVDGRNRLTIGVARV